MSDPPPASAIVIGAGVIGLTTAIALAHRGLAVTLVDPDPCWAGASWGNAGHIATEQLAPLASWATIRSVPRRLFARGGPLALPLAAASTWLPFAARLTAAARHAARGEAALGAMLTTALPAWRTLLHRARVPELLHEDGHFILWESAATAAAGRARWAAANTGTASFRESTPDERSALARLTMATIAGAIRFNGTARMTDLRAMEAKLRQYFAATGGRSLIGRATRLEAGTSAIVHLADGSHQRADLAVVAAGALSAALLRPLGYHVPLIAERGYHLESDAPDWPEDTPPLVFEDRSLIVTRFAHGLRVASFTEFAAPDTPPDARKWNRLHAHVADLGLPLTTSARRWIGARPTLPDYLPAIGRCPRRPALAYAFGHQHLGLTLAAATAEALACHIVGQPPAFALAAFDLLRLR